MPSVAERIRASRWRQGSIVRRSDAGQVLAKSIDQVPHQETAPPCLVVISQDCDLLRDPDIEPYAELILCREAAHPEPLYQNGRNPRRLHIETIGPRETVAWLDITIHDRFRIEKKALAGVSVDDTHWMKAGEVRLLGRWLAKRYTRPAFPDAFNQRLEHVDKKLEALFKSRDGRVVTGIYVAVSEEEYLDERAYEIGVRITANIEVWEKKESLKLLQNFENRFAWIVESCPGIQMLEDDIVAVPEDDLTVADLRRFKRLDKDYRSIPLQPPVLLPVDSTQTL